MNIILHIDMDAFFSAVEVREDPSLRGKPVVIGADPAGGAGRGVVSTCSYEARRFGIHSAMPISVAYRLCPEAVYLPVRGQLYREVSDRIMRLLEDYSETVLQVSVDEAFLDLSDLESFSAAKEVARAIKHAIKRTEGLTCSIGIAPGRTIAKIASDFHKPDGLTVVEPDTVVGFLAPLPVGRIPGIGKKTGGELNEMGIATIGDLASFDVQQLISRFGRGGIAMQQFARGFDQATLGPRRERRSISREITFPVDTCDPVMLQQAAEDLVTDVHRLLVQKQLRYRTVTLKVRSSGFVTKTRSRSLPLPTADIAVLRTLVRSLFSEMHRGAVIRLIGVKLSNFDATDTLQTLLDDYTRI